MKRSNEIFNRANKLTAVFMVTALLWLTVSIPFVTAAQQQQQAYSENIPSDKEVPGSEESNPFSNTTEEKAESGSNSLSEYLHHIHELIHPAGPLHKHNCSHEFDVYVAFHGEMLCPPPNFILS